MRQAGLRVVVILLLATLLAAPLCAAERYRIAPGDSIVRFTVTKLMVERVSGDFHDCRGVITFNPDHPKDSSIEISIVVRSVTTGARQRDRTLQNEDFFDSERYPLMEFRSVSVAPRDNGGLYVTGDLTIRGVTRRITVPVRVTQQNETIAFETTFTLDRTDFGVNGTRWTGGRAVISHEADIYLRIVARPGETR